MNNFITLRESVQNYQQAGFAVIPVTYKQKSPNLTDWPSRKPDDLDIECDFPDQDSNLGIVLGENSGSIVDIDLDCPEAVKLAPSFLPETEMIFGRDSKPASHWIYRVVGDCDSRKYLGPNGVLLEIRGDKAQTIFPPSVHPSGEVVRFDERGTPSNIRRNELEESVELLAFATLLVQLWREGIRHDLSMAVAGVLLSSGRLDREDVENFLMKICEVAGDTEVNDRVRTVADTEKKLKGKEKVSGWPTMEALVGKDVARKLHDWLVGENQPQSNQGGLGIRADLVNGQEQMTDRVNGMLFVEQHESRAKFVKDIGCWMAWDGRKWEMNAKGAIRRMAHETTHSLFTSLADISPLHLADMCRWARQSNNKGSIDAMLSEARPYLEITNDELDVDAWLLNCRNGMVDLRTGELLPHDPKSLITQYTNIEYNPDAICPRFEAFLNEIFNNDAAVIGFVQRALGYSLTGSTEAQCFFVAHGSGANGKSTLMETIEDVMGDYVCTSPVDTLMETSRKGSVPNDIARLRGKRMIKASEGESQQKLSESLIKRLTGGDTVTARFMREEFFEFKPIGKIWLATNHKPQISGQDPAMWRRVHLIPFDVTIPEHKRDPQLKDKLIAEKEGILAWMVRGCLDWQAQRLNPPERIARATAEYRDEMDVVGAFLRERVQEHLNSTVSKGDMHKAFEWWCIENGHEVISKPNFGKMLASRGIADKRGTGGVQLWKDLILLDPDLMC